MLCTNFGAQNDVTDNTALESSYSVAEILKRSLLLRHLRGLQKVAENYGRGCEDTGTSRMKAQIITGQQTTKNRKYIY